jgi:hypothetical protein
MATSSTEILRLHYYERQYLGAADLEDQQTYHRDMRRRHNIGDHTWGIVTGLELVAETDPGDSGAVLMWVNPGMAIDGFGREIIALSRFQLDPSLFAAYASQGFHTVWISYLQESVDPPQAGYSNCDASTQYGRIEETYQIVIDPKSPTHDDITVGGEDAQSSTSDITLPADLSTPYQEFPDDDTAPEWLVQIGKVNWDGVNQKFIPGPSTDFYPTGRSYVGVVAGTVYAPGASLMLQPRTLFSDPDAQDFAEVNGRLQVDGRIEAEKDVLIQGGTLRFNDNGGSDDTVPLWMQRQGNPGGSGYDLRMHISDSKDATNRAVVGYKDGSEKDVLAVKADNTVDILTGSLNFGQTTRQMVNLYQQTYGIGIQGGTLYERTNSQFCWFLGGTHSDTAGDPGSGGTLLLKLDSSANLTMNAGGDLNMGPQGEINMGAQTRQMINLWNQNYGIGVQTGTLYFRTDSDFCWFKRGSHSDNRDDPGSGGSLSMKLDDGANLSVSGSVSTGNDLSVNGNLFVNGSQNLITCLQTTLAVKNNGQGPATWSWSYFGRFKQIYVVFAVLQGFSIWDNSIAGPLPIPIPSGTYFHNFPGGAQSTDAIPQHVFVQVNGFDNNSASGTCFCQESLAGNETDNTVLFTVVAIGRPS